MGQRIISHMNTYDAQAQKDRYRRHAAEYDKGKRFSDRIRSNAIRRLDLKPGESVLDLGCGTGLSFDMLQQGVGPQGRIIGVELSPEMLEIAQEKVERNGWENVTLIQGDAQTVEVPSPLDGVLAFFVPEILISPPAVTRAMDSMNPGGRLVAAGVKHAQGVLGPLFNLYFQVRFRTWRWVGVRGAMNRIFAKSQPYAALEKAVPRLERQDYMLGCAYIARTVKGR